LVKIRKAVASALTYFNGKHLTTEKKYENGRWHIALFIGVVLGAIVWLYLHVPLPLRYSPAHLVLYSPYRYSDS
jgi:integral membrane sensor domain MASE1